MPPRNEGTKVKKVPIKEATVGANFILERWAYPDDTNDRSRGTDMRRVGSVLFPIVETYERPRPPALTRRWTIGKGLPYREHSGQRQQTISLSGTSGLEPREAADRSSMPIIASGYELFFEFEAFIDEYLRDASSQAGALSRNFKAPRLVFRALHERDAFFVEVVNFTPTRNVHSANATWHWSIQLVTDGIFKDPVDKEASREGREVTRDAQWNGLNNSLDSFIAKNTTVGGVGQKELAEATARNIGGSQVSLDVVQVTDIGAELDKLSASLSTIRGPVISLMKKVQKSRETIGSLRRLGRFPVAMINDIGTLAREANEAVFDLFTALPVSTRARKELRRSASRISAKIDKVELDSLAAIGSTGARAGTVSSLDRDQAPSSVEIRSSSGCTITTVLKDETIEDVAQRTLNVASRWGEIVRLNDMLSAWQLADGTPLVPGVQLYVPALGGGGVQVTQGRSVYGTDIKWKRDGHITWRDGDWVLSRGTANLYQGITRRCMIQKRQNKVFPGLGLEPIVGRKGLAQVVPYVAGDIRAQMVADHRVESVTDVLVSMRNDAVLAEFTVNAVSGETVPVTAPFPSIL